MIEGRLSNLFTTMINFKTATDMYSNEKTLLRDKLSHIKMTVNTHSRMQQINLYMTSKKLLRHRRFEPAKDTMHHVLRQHVSSNYSNYICFNVIGLDQINARTFL